LEAEARLFHPVDDLSRPVDHDHVDHVDHIGPDHHDHHGPGDDNDDRSRP
jgi:hypothetical protein